MSNVDRKFRWLTHVEIEMELIILGLVGSLATVLSHLLEFISQRPGYARSAVASTQTTREADAELQIEPRAAPFRQWLQEQKRVRPPSAAPEA